VRLGDSERRQFVADRGWRNDDYQDWLAETISRTILG